MPLFDTSKLLGFLGAQSDASRAAFLELLSEHESWAMHADTATLTRYLTDAAAEIDGKRKARLPKANGTVAIIPVEGVMSPKGYGAGTLAIGRAFDAAMANDRVGGVVMLHDSPGGVVWGTPELGKRIYEARGAKPIVTMVEHLSASASYWVGTASDKVVVAPSGHVGSVGVFRTHCDVGKAFSDAGINMTIVKAGRFKVEGNPFEPLSDEARAEYQRGVDEVYKDFIENVAMHRGTSRKDVKDNFGEGRVVEAKRAVELGMADRAMTLEQVLDEMFPAQTTKGRAAAEASEEITAELVAAWNGSVEKVVEPSGVRAEDMRRRRERRERMRA